MTNHFAESAELIFDGIEKLPLDERIVAIQDALAKFVPTVMTGQRRHDGL